MQSVFLFYQLSLRGTHIKTETKGGVIMSASNYEQPYIDNIVVGYHNDKVIVKQDDGALFFCEIPENLIMPGETMAPRDLTSISVLPADEQEEIRIKYADS